MPNRWIRVQDTYPQLYELGIPFFGFYDFKTAMDRIDVHEHGNCYEISYLEKGMQPYYVHSDRGTAAQGYRLHGGDVFITYPHEYHSTGEFHQLRGRMYWIHLDVDNPSFLGLPPANASLLKKALGEINSHMIRIPNSVGNRFKEAYTLFHQPSQERIFCACQLLSLFIIELAEQCRKTTVSGLSDHAVSARSLECMSFIDSNILNPDLNVQMIADTLHYSRTYIMTAFRNETGMSVHEYILNRKIQYACDLLETHSITETALMLNFSSSQHFSKVFKDHTQMTPRGYRLSALRGKNESTGE